MKHFKKTTVTKRDLRMKNLARLQERLHNTTWNHITSCDDVVQRMICLCKNSLKYLMQKVQKKQVK